MKLDQIVATQRNALAEEVSWYSKWSALEKHVFAFGAGLANGAIVYSSQSIAAVLKQHGESSPRTKGAFVHFFNAVHTGQCPYGKNLFSEQGQKNFSKALHLGTLRLYNSDGSFNEENWGRFESTCCKDGKVISQSELLLFLAQQTKTLPQEPCTGRNNASFFSNKLVQETAGSAAWKELFTILVTEWNVIDEKQTPCIDKELLRLFFEDSPVALAVAAELKLRCLKPTESNEQGKVYSCC